MLQRRGLSLDRLASFLVIARAGGLARAAPGDPVRQSQLSRQLKELEVALGQALFVRARGGLELTAAGTELARCVRTFEQELSAISGRAESPRVVLGGADSVLQWLVLPALSRLGEVRGLELLTLGAAATVSALQEGRVDLGLLRAGEARGDFKTVRLGAVEYAVFGARSLPLAVPSGEPGLAAALAALGPPALVCETFPQVAQVVRAGTHAGVLPLFARPALAGVARPGKVLAHAGSVLLLAWRPATLTRRAEVRALRVALERVLRPALG